VKWLLQDRDFDSTGQRISPVKDDFHALRQRLWDLQEEVDLNLFGETGLEFTMRRFSHAQIEFQRSLDRGLFRDVGLIMQLPAQHPLVQMAREVLQLDLVDYVGLSLWLMGMIGRGHRAITQELLQDAALAFPADAVGRFMELVAPDLARLQRLLRKRDDAVTKKGSEFFETPALTHAPLLHIGDAVLVWHPTLVSRGLEVLLHRQLAATFGAKYMKHFSPLFERHVVAQARRTECPVHDEDALRPWLPFESKLVDAALELPNGVLLVEAKAGLWDEDIMSCGNPTWLAQNTKALRTGIEQLQTVAGLLEGAEQATVGLRQNAVVGVLVTNLELRVGTASRLAAMYPPGQLAPRTAAQENGAHRLPLERIYIIGATSYDRLTEAARTDGLDVVAFLEDCLARDRHGLSLARMSLDHHLDDQQVRQRESPPSQKARESALARAQCHVASLQAAASGSPTPSSKPFDPAAASADGGKVDVPKTPPMAS
jgi:hypothetical protein